MRKATPQVVKDKNDSQEYLEDLSKLPKFKLLEMLDRQRKLLNNRAALAKLPDKGAKVMQSRKKIEDELEKRNLSNSNLCDVMADLTLTAPQINLLEWAKNTEELKKEPCVENSNDSENDLLEIIATHSGTFSSKSIRIEERPKELVTKEDIEDVHTMKLCNKIDNIEVRERFLPHKTLHRAYDSRKLPTQFKPQDLCSALEPKSKFTHVKPISLESSILLQYEQAQHLKQVQLEHAESRLKDKTYNIGNIVLSDEKLKQYRNPAIINSDSELEDEEIEEVEDDCLPEDSGGIVTYHVID